MPLTDITIKKTKPGEKVIRRWDSGGLYLEISPNGGRWWRFKYRFAGKEKRASLGVYPEVSLKDARASRDKMRVQLHEGIDPTSVRRKARAAQIEANGHTFEQVAREWFERQERSAWTPGHARTVLLRLENNVFPWLRSRPISAITTPELLTVLRRVEERGAIETAHRIQVIFGQVFRYAIASGLVERDPSRDLRGALMAVTPRHLPAITDPVEFGKLLVKIDNYAGSHVVRCALRLAPLVFVRPGELRHARWEQINFETAEWRFIASKTQTEHVVPLSTQAIAILREVRPLTGRYPWVFPSARSNKKPMSENAVLAALRGMDFAKEQMSGHGFRAAARTMLDEVLGERVDLIEQQLAHKVRDPLGRAYNRTAHLSARREMMQRWADYLDKLKCDCRA